MSLEMKYFILKPKGNTVHARASRLAMRQYAATIQENDPEVARDLCEWADREYDRRNDGS